MNKEVADYIRASYKAAEKLGSMATESGIEPATMFEQVYENIPSHLQQQLEAFEIENIEKSEE